MIKTKKLNKLTKKLNKKTKRTHKNNKTKGTNKTQKIKKMNGGGARLSAIKGAFADTGRAALRNILTMENPIVYAYQVIERNVFGWDTVDQEKKMSATQNKIFGDILEKKNKDFTLKQFLKGKKGLKPPVPPEL